MIQFFRRIRHGLLHQNRFSKYLLYAIGEIILVVIGILMALQINNWNETRKIKRTESQILKGLGSEFEGALLEVTLDQIQRTKIDSSLHRLMNVINQKHDAVLPTDSIPKALDRLLSYRFYTPSHPVLDDLQSSGRMDVIQSDSLRHLITRYIQDRDRLQVVEKRGMDFVQNEAESFLRPRVNLSWLFSDIPELQKQALGSTQELLEDTEFASIVILRIHKLEVSIHYGERLKETILNIIECIDKSYE